MNHSFVDGDSVVVTSGAHKMAGPVSASDATSITVNGRVLRRDKAGWECDGHRCSVLLKPEVAAA